MALRVFGRYLLYGGATASVCYFVYRRFWKRKPEDDFFTDCDNFLDIPDCDYCEDHAEINPGLDYINVDQIVCKKEKCNIEVKESDVEEDKSHNTDLCIVDGITMDNTDMVNVEVEEQMNFCVDIEKTVKEVLDGIISKVEKDVDSASTCESFEGRQSNGTIKLTDSSAVFDSKFDFEKWKWLEVDDVKPEVPEANKVRKAKGRRKFKGLRKFFKRLSCIRKAGED